MSGRRCVPELQIRCYLGRHGCKTVRRRRVVVPLSRAKIRRYLVRGCRVLVLGLVCGLDRELDQGFDQSSLAPA